VPLTTNCERQIPDREAYLNPAEVHGESEREGRAWHGAWGISLRARANRSAEGRVRVLGDGVHVVRARLCRPGTPSGATRDGRCGRVSDVARWRWALRSSRMFEGLCYFNGTQWNGISYKGGGLSTHHGSQLPAAAAAAVAAHRFLARAWADAGTCVCVPGRRACRRVGVSAG